MKLVHTDVNGDKHLVSVGYIFGDGPDEYIVRYMPKPHKASSTGKVTISNVLELDVTKEVFAHVIDMEWIGYDHPEVKLKQVIELACEIMGDNPREVEGLNLEDVIKYVKDIDMEHLQYYPQAAPILCDWLKEQRND